MINFKSITNKLFNKNFLYSNKKNLITKLLSDFYSYTKQYKIN